MDEGGNLANEGEDNGKYGGAGNDPGAVYAGHGHDAHVFTVGGVRRGAYEAGNDIGQAVGKEGAVQAGIFDQISSYNITGHKEMAQVFRKNHEYRRQNHHNGGQIEMGRIESGESHPGHFFHMVEIHYPHEDGKDVAGNDADEDGDDGNETPSQHRSQDGHHQSKHGNGDGRGRRHTLGFADKAGHGHGQGRQLQPDDGHNGPHGSRREEHVNPVHPCLLHQKGQENKAETEGNESSLGVGIGHTRRGRHCQHRGNKGKGRAQVGRELPFADGQVQKGAYAVHEKAGGRVHIQKKGNQHRRAEHGKEMLQAQGDGGENGKPFLHLNNAFTHFFTILSWEALIHLLFAFILELLCNARNKATRIASYLRGLMTKQCIKIFIKANSVIESVLPLKKTQKKEGPFLCKRPSFPNHCQIFISPILFFLK